MGVRMMTHHRMINGRHDAAAAADAAVGSFAKHEMLLFIYYIDLTCFKNNLKNA